MEKADSQEQPGSPSKSFLLLVTMTVLGLCAWAIYQAFEKDRETYRAWMAAETAQIEACERGGGYALYTGHGDDLRPIKRADGSVACERP